jgi:hypothetical protein
MTCSEIRVSPFQTVSVAKLQRIDLLHDVREESSGYLVDHPFDSIVDVIETVDLIRLRFLACMGLLRAVRLCPQESVAGLQDACRSVFFP